MRNKVKKMLFWPLVFLMVPSFANAATPIINNVNGTIATGQTLTINGSNLSNQNKTNWTISEEAGGFELGQVGNKVGSYYSIDGWSLQNGVGSPAFYDSNEKLLGNQSMRGDVIGTGKLEASTSRTYQYNNPDMYFRYYFKHQVGYDWPDNFHKQAIIGAAYVQPVRASVTGFNPISQYHTGSSGSSDFNVNLPSSLYGGKLNEGRWYCVEVRRRQGSSFSPTQSSDAHTQVWIDGVEISNFSNSYNDQSQGWGFFQLGLINGDVFTNANSSFWMDGAMVSTSRIYPAAMVEIGNSSNYATATKVKQPFQYISDSQIRITADLTGLGSGPYYLFVTNNTQEKNTGLLLGSSASDTTAPIISNPRPASILPYGTTSTSMQVTTNETATCKYGTSNVSYASLANTFTTTGGTSHSQALSGLTNGSSTTYYVRCSDGSGNANTASTVITVAVSGSAPVNGACGSASGETFTYLDSSSSNLCTTGTVSAFSGTGPWTWGCNGLNGGTSTESDACSASLNTSQDVPLFSESFSNSNFFSRGWYDNYNHGVIATSGCQTGNCLEWSWAAGQTKPTNGNAMRKKFTPTDKLYVSFYTKFQTGWRGSQKDYHPHMINILSDLDSDYSALAGNYLNTYIEFISDTVYPYLIRPTIALQDNLRVNTSSGTPPNDLTAATENRSVNHCNGYKSDQDRGQIQTCYNVGGGYWYSATSWKNENMFVTPNEWHKVELYFQMNSIDNNIAQADGIMKEWIDGQETINHSNVIYRTAQDATKKWAQFDLAPYIGDGSPIDQKMWLDELLLASNLPESLGSPLAPVGLRAE